jgi:alpha-glucosidase
MPITKIETKMTDWSISRLLPKGKKKWEPVKNIFKGESLTEQLSLEGTPVIKLSVHPKSQKTFPQSFAVLEEHPWQPRKESALPFGLTWQQSSPGRFHFDFDLPKGMKCLGLGERFSGLDLRYGTHTLCATDDGDHDEATDSMYKAIPILIVSNGKENFALFLDSPAPQRWHLDADLDEKGHIELFSTRGWQMYLIGPASLPDIVKSYTHLTGRAQLPPRWALGYFQCRYSYPDEGTVLQVANEFRQRKIPCDVMVLDIDYMDEYRAFTTSKERFPHFDAMVEELLKNNFKVVTIIDPGIKKDPKYQLFKEGLKNDLFCKTADGKLFLEKVWPGISAFPDFLKPETRAWWVEKLRFYTDRNITGIWNDMNEPAFFGNMKPFPPELEEMPAVEDQPFVQQATDGEVGHLEVRNLYGLLMCQCTHEGLLTYRPKERPFILTRAAYAGIQRYAATWLGDNKSFFEHLANSLPMLLNMGLSGATFCGADVGGFGKNADSDLLLRWFELGIFYPFFRNHSGMGTHAQEPWAHSPLVEKLCRNLIETRYRLLPYMQILFWEHWRTGAPLMRPLSWHYPDDQFACEVDDQFLFGKDILVAPILRRGRTKKSVYFPKGLWHPFDGGAPLAGGQAHIVELPLGCVPAFVRDGAVIPLSTPMQNTADYDNADITFVAYGDTASGVYIEDDGESLAWQEGTYNEWQVNFSGGKLVTKALHQQYKAPKRTYYLSHNSAHQAKPELIAHACT